MQQPARNLKWFWNAISITTMSIIMQMFTELFLHLDQVATEMMEDARKKVQHFINAKHDYEVLFIRHNRRYKPCCLCYY
jgi:hypothetical protein